MYARSQSDPEMQNRPTPIFLRVSANHIRGNVRDMECHRAHEPSTAHISSNFNVTISRSSISMQPACAFATQGLASACRGQKNNTDQKAIVHPMFDRDLGDSAESLIPGTFRPIRLQFCSSAITPLGRASGRKEGPCGQLQTPPMSGRGLCWVRLGCLLAPALA